VRLLGAQQDVVVGAHAVDERDRHAAARVAEPGLLVEFGQREQRQGLADVPPAVRVEAVALCLDARILEVAHADIERREREPGSVGFGNARGQLRLKVAEVACRCHHAFARVQPVGDAERLRGALGELHESPDAGLARGARVPSGLLVGDRREQAPFDAVVVLRRHEQRFPLGQRALDAFGEDARVDATDFAARREVALRQSCDRAVAVHACEEGVEVPCEFGMPSADRPGEFALRAERERDLDVEIDVAPDRGVVRTHDGAGHATLVDQRQQSVRGRQVPGLPANLRMRPAHLRERGLDARGGDVRDVRSGEVAPVARAKAVAGAEQHRLRRLVAGRPQERGALRAGVARRLAGGRAVQAADPDVRLACGDALEKSARVGDGDDGERKLPLAGEALDQVVVESLRLAVGSGKPASRTRTHGHDQCLRVVGRREFGDVAGGNERRDGERRRPGGEMRRYVQRSRGRGMSHRGVGLGAIRVYRPGAGRAVRTPGTAIIGSSPVALSDEFGRRHPRRVAPHCMVVNLVRSGRKQP